MKHFKIFTSLLLTFILTLSVAVVDPVTVMATLPNVPGGGGTTYVPLPLVSLYETLRDTYNDGGTPFDFIKESIKNSGFLSPEIPALKDLSSLDQYIGNNEPELKGDTPEDTAKNVSQYLVHNTQIVSDNSVKINSNVKNFNNKLINNYVNGNKINLFYACGLQESLNSLNSTIVADMAEIIEDNPDSYFILINTNPSIFFIVFKENGNKIYGVLNHTYDSSWSDFRLYQAVTINGIVSTRTFTANSSDDMVAYIYNASNQHLEPYTVSYPWNDNAANHGYFNVLPLQAAGGSDWNRYPKAFNTISQSIETFNSVTELNDYISTYGIGKSPYYYNQEVWQNFSTSSGDYVFSPTNINTVTYGDVSEYIDNSYQDNDDYPDNSQINNWIENTNQENITNNNGGGSGGSGGDDSGSDYPSDIFGWLKQLGAVLSSLIKGVGEFLTEIVSGLVSAITDLLESLSSLVTGVLESLTNIFSGLISFLFDGLPDEVKSVLTLGLTVALLITVIKLIRGN